MTYKKRFLLIFIMAICHMMHIAAAPQFITFSKGQVLLNPTNNVNICLDPNDCPGVDYAVKALETDFKTVCDARCRKTDEKDARIIIGTLGHSAAIDRIVKDGRLNGKLLKGKWEKFVITTLGDQLVIAGSDRRGTIYGIYELSRQMGISPWHYWADVPTAHHDSIYAQRGLYTDGEPAVKYRGIFINDEAPCLTTWVKNTFGTNYGGHQFYEKVFELILRLRGNMMWPAMWGWSFYADDSLNEQTANHMGIVIGTSHHEPMARNHQEWVRHRAELGAWNYVTNKHTLQRFFTQGIERMKGTEQIVTVGMRGDGDEAMSNDVNTELLENIIADQRKIISRVTGKPAEATPQLWALYKEVLDYYDKGMKVPDDITLMLCDDNWGDIRRVPTLKARHRKGGWGLYYHVDYVGAPRNSKFINVTPVQNMWEQLSLAYHYGIDRIWMLNVGDIKPMELPISMFMKMAWNPDEYGADSITQYVDDFCREQFGDKQAPLAARLLNLCCKYNGRCTPEMLDASTYNLENGDWLQIVNEYNELETQALRQYSQLCKEQRDAYNELVLFPISVMANLHRMYYAQAMNHKCYAEGNPMADVWAKKCKEAFNNDSVLCADYNHNIAQGKWNGMMIQKHISYTSWNDDFAKDTCPTCYGQGMAEQQGGATLRMCKGKVVFEAPFYFSRTDGKGTQWTQINDMGKWYGAMRLLPDGQSIDGASLTYRFTTDSLTNTMMGDSLPVKVSVIVKSTLDFLNKGAFSYTVQVDEGTPTTVYFNKNLNEKPENIYSVYYPTVARRVVKNNVMASLRHSSDGTHTIRITPNDPAIVFERIVIEAIDR